MDSVALGFPVFMRTGRLKNLLWSVPEDVISTVYVADNGDSDERAEVYDTEYPFELSVIDLEYDAGIGACRRAVADACTEDFLVVTDVDMEIPESVTVLIDQLQAKPDYGAIAGILLEPERLYSGHTLYISELSTYKGDVVYFRLSESESVDTVCGYPLKRFDLIVNAAVFRTKCFNSYSWDPALKHFAHADFYIGMKKKSNWKFGVNPAVQFPHYPGGDGNYVSHRWGEQRLKRYRQKFLEKWDYADYLYSRDKCWIQSHTSKPFRDEFGWLVNEQLPIAGKLFMWDMLKKVGVGPKS